MNTTLAERINECLAEKGADPGDLATACGVKVQSVYQWQSGKTQELAGKNLLRAAAFFGVRPEWLDTGKGHKQAKSAPPIPEGATVAVHDGPGELDPEAYVWIDRYDLKLSAGNGNADWVIKEKDPISFRRSWFAQRRLVPNHCKAMYVRGRSMQPVLNDWDTVLINTDDTEVVDGEVYAAVYKGALYIKTLERMGSGIRLKSENPEFASIEVADEDLEKLHILGRKVWRAG